MGRPRPLLQEWVILLHAWFILLHTWFILLHTWFILLHEWGHTAAISLREMEKDDPRDVLAPFAVQPGCC
jgi:hypothetical protein